MQLQKQNRKRIRNTKPKQQRRLKGQMGLPGIVSVGEEIPTDAWVANWARETIKSL